MNTRENIVRLLEMNRNHYISGQHIANDLNISRAAVWKSIQQLQKDGYKIEALPNKGYKLKDDSDVLSEQAIRFYLSPIYKDCPIHLYSTLDSTNKRLKEMTAANALQHTIVVANDQSAGSGRFHRSFYSPKDTGVYMSLLIRDHQELRDASMITLMAGVTLCRVLKRFSKYQPRIKWVNDIYIEDKKVCGILTEAIIDFESRTSSAMIVGIGVNISTKQFPKDLSDRAISCHGLTCSRSQLIAEIVNELLTIYASNDYHTLIEEYRTLSYVLHKQITYTHEKQQYTGFVRDINDRGNLIVEHTNGVSILDAGEIEMVRANES